MWCATRSVLHIICTHANSPRQHPPPNPPQMFRHVSYSSYDTCILLLIWPSPNPPTLEIHRCLQPLALREVVDPTVANVGFYPYTTYEVSSPTSPAVCECVRVWVCACVSVCVCECVRVWVCAWVLHTYACVWKNTYTYYTSDIFL
jgi:hypothetical protein